MGGLFFFFRFFHYPFGCTTPSATRCGTCNFFWAQVFFCSRRGKERRPSELLLSPSLFSFLSLSFSFSLSPSPSPSPPNIYQKKKKKKKKKKTGKENFQQPHLRRQPRRQPQAQRVRHPKVRRVLAPQRLEVQRQADRAPAVHLGRLAVERRDADLRGRGRVGRRGLELEGELVAEEVVDVPAGARPLVRVCFDFRGRKGGRERIFFVSGGDWVEKREAGGRRHKTFSFFSLFSLSLFRSFFLPWSRPCPP